MKRFLRAFLFAWRGLRWKPVAPWTDDDQKRLEGFLASRSGALALQLLTNIGTEKYRHAAQMAQSGNVWWSGHAAGFEDCIAQLRTLSAPAPTGEQDGESELGAPGFFEPESLP